MIAAPARFTRVGLSAPVSRAGLCHSRPATGSTELGRERVSMIDLAQDGAVALDNGEARGRRIDDHGVGSYHAS